MRHQLLLPVYVLFLGLFPTLGMGEDTYKLEESAGKPQVFRVKADVDVRGQLHTTAGKDKKQDLDLKVEAKFDFRERRLAGAGRDAAALRALRQYDQAEAKITVNNNRSFSALNLKNPVIVAHGKREGIVFYQPQKAIARNELELLQMPGDGLAMLGLLPQTAVEVGQKWTAENWAVQMLTGTEALLKCEVSCELQSVKNNIATVTVNGQIEGATEGATTKIDLDGKYVFDIKRGYLRTVELTQTEARSVGAVSPGMDVIATVRLERSPAVGEGRLTETAADQIPLEPTEDQLQLALNLPWNASVSHNRDWHVFQDTPHLAVIRYVQGGSLIAQCNLSPITPPKAGTVIRDSELAELAKKGLGESLEKVVKIEDLPRQNGIKLQRLIATGKSQDIAMTWHYYLATANNRQMLFFVAVETELKEKLGEADLNLVKTLTMQKPELIPASGQK